MKINKTSHIIITCIISTLTVMLFTGASLATNYYVDATNGNDSNSGTSASAAWKTISKVNNSTFNPGDQILFKRGEVWRGMLEIHSSGTQNNYIIVGAYGSGDKPIIKGSRLLTDWTNHSGNIWKAVCSTSPSNNQVFFNGEWGTKQSQISNLNKEKDWYWSSSTLYIYSGNNPISNYVNPGIEVSNREQCIKLVDCGYITVQDIHVTQGIDDGILIWDYRAFLIKNVLAEKSHRACILSGEGNITVSHCEARYSASEHGIYFGQATINSVIEYCHLHHNCQEGIQINPENQGDYKTYNMIIRYNHIHDNRNGMGLHATNNSKIYYNIIYNNSRSGISFWDHGGGPGFGCTNNQVYNNTILVSPTADGAACGISARQYSTSNTYKNNIIYVTDNNAPNWYISGDSYSGMVIDNNCSYRTSGSNIGYINWQNKTWAEWRASGHDVHGINADPQWQSANPDEVADFRLQPDSPCINMGTTVGLTEDYYGTDITNSPDAGFCEIAQIKPPNNLRIIFPSTRRGN